MGDRHRALLLLVLLVIVVVDPGAQAHDGSHTHAVVNQDDSTFSSDPTTTITVDGIQPQQPQYRVATDDGSSAGGDASASGLAFAQGASTDGSSSSPETRAALMHALDYILNANVATQLQGVPSLQGLEGAPGVDPTIMGRLRALSFLKEFQMYNLSESIFGDTSAFPQPGDPVSEEINTAATFLADSKCYFPLNGKVDTDVATWRYYLATRARLTNETDPFGGMGDVAVENIPWAQFPLICTNDTFTVPPWLGSFEWMNHLVISIATSDGVRSVGTLPESIGNLSELTSINLSGGIGGTLPRSLGRLTNLAALLLPGNALVGEIPEEIGMCENLSRLWLNQNGLSGVIPASLANLTKIQEVMLYDNALVAPLAPELLTLQQRLGQDFQFQGNPVWESMKEDPSAVARANATLEGWEVAIIVLASCLAAATLVVSVSWAVRRANGGAHGGSVPSQASLSLSCVGSHAGASTQSRGKKEWAASLPHGSPGGPGGPGESRPEGRGVGGVGGDMEEGGMPPPMGASVASDGTVVIDTDAFPGPSMDGDGTSNAKHLAMLSINRKDLRLVKLIGRGSYGTVYEAEWSGKPVAVKIMNMADHTMSREASRKIIRTFEQEVECLSHLRHDNIVRLFGYSLAPPHVYLVQELMARNLHELIYAPEGYQPDYMQILVIIREIARGLAYLHPRIVHCDLKPHNILLGDDGVAKVSEKMRWWGMRPPFPRWEILSIRAIHPHPPTHYTFTIPFLLVCFGCLLNQED